jgi:rod shape-determining protein MreC
MKQEISSKTHVALACLGFFLLSLFLTAYSAKNPAVARIGTSLVLKVTTPVLQLIEVARGSGSSVWNGYIGLRSAALENQELTRRLSDLESRLALFNELERENLRLRELLNFSAEKQLRGVTAAVIGGDSSGWIKGIVVNKGSDHGVLPGMAVIHPEGVVGQVIAVTAKSSKVLLVSDHASGVDVLIQGSRARGVVEGAGEQVCELKFLTKDQQVRVGDPIITSGMDGVYPKGVVVGYVSQVGSSAAGLFQPVEIKPAVDFSRLEEVLLVPSSAAALGGAVLNHPARDAREISRGAVR